MANPITDPGPLDWRVSIVDKQGRPSPEFQRRWNTNRNNTAQIGTITFGSGAPPSTPAPSDGAEYADTLTDPFTLYVGQGGVWNLASPQGANPTAVAKDTAIDGTATTFMRSDAAPAVQKATSAQFGIVKVDGTTVEETGGVVSVPTATTSTLGLVKPDGSTINISTGLISVPIATTSQFGLVKPDGTTVTITGGVISAASGGAGVSFGTGAPVGTPTAQGDFYFDDSSVPYAGYVSNYVSSGGGTGSPSIDGTPATATFSGGASGSVTLSTAIANDLILVMVSHEKAGTSNTCTSVTASGLTFTKVAAETCNVNGSDQETSIWSAQATGLLSGVAITVNLSGATDDAAIAAMGITNFNSLTPFDPNVSLPASAPRAGGASPGPSVIVSTSYSNALLLYVYGNDNNSSGGSPSGMTQAFTVTNSGGSLYASLRADYQAFSTPQTNVTVTCPQSGSISGSMIVVALTNGGGGSVLSWVAFN